METIVRDGKVIGRSRNLAGIRRYVGNHLIVRLAVDRITVCNYWEGRLHITFDNGATFETRFADYGVLLGFVRRWRNVYGAPLVVNGRVAGRVEYRNRALDIIAPLFS